MNALVMCVPYHDMSETLEASLFFVNVFFAVIFALEAAIKILRVTFEIGRVILGIASTSCSLS